MSELHRSGPTRLQLAALVVAALVTMIIMVGASGHPNLAQVTAGTVRLWIRHLTFTLRHTF